MEATGTVNPRYTFGLDSTHGTLNIIGAIPFVGMGAGCARIIYAIHDLAKKAIPKGRFGLEVLRGVIEIIPIGGIALVIFDRILGHAQKKSPSSTEQEKPQETKTTPEPQQAPPRSSEHDPIDDLLPTFVTTAPLLPSPPDRIPSKRPVSLEPQPPKPTENQPSPPPVVTQPKPLPEQPPAAPAQPTPPPKPSSPPLPPPPVSHKPQPPLPLPTTTTAAPQPTHSAKKLPPIIQSYLEQTQAPDPFLRKVAAYALGEYYEKGIALEQPKLEEAARWYSQAQKLQHNTATSCLIRVYYQLFIQERLLDVAELDKVVNLLQENSAHDSFAQATLGLMYLKGFGVPEDLKQAKKYLDLAKLKLPEPLVKPVNIALEDLCKRLSEKTS